MLASAVMRNRPLRVNDWRFANLDDAVARTKARRCSGLGKFHVRPLILMIVNVVRNLAEQNPVGPQDTHRFVNEQRVEIGEGIAVLLRGAPSEPKPGIEVLLLVFALIRNMGWIIDNYIKSASPKWHQHVVANDRWAMGRRYVHPNDLAFGSSPKPSTIDRSVKYALWFAVRVEIEHPL